MCPVVPLGVPHGTIQDQVFLESKWQLPRGTMLMVSHWNINYDPDIYEDPYIFKPKRFLKQPTTINGGTTAAAASFIPFQVKKKSFSS
jgi:cytochrome P450